MPGFDPLIRYCSSVRDRSQLANMQAPAVDALAFCVETNSLYRFENGNFAVADGRKTIRPLRPGDDFGRWIEISPGQSTYTETVTPAGTGLSTSIFVYDITELVAGLTSYGISVGIQAHFETEETWAYVLHRAICRDGNWVTAGVPVSNKLGPALNNGAPTFSVGTATSGGRTHIEVVCTYQAMTSTYEVFDVVGAMSFDVRFW